MSIYLEGLNPQQKKAVETVHGTVQICAVAGAGKTRVFTQRIAYMVNELGINPESILATTFTQKAGKEIKSRLEKLLNKNVIDKLTLGTTHSIGYRILKEEYNTMNHRLAGAFKKYDGTLSGWKHKKFVKEVFEQIEKMYSRNWEAERALKEMKLPMFLKVISTCKNNNISHDEYAQNVASKNNIKLDMYSTFYTMYEQKKEMECVIDFDDMLFLTVRLLQSNKNVLKKYQQKFDYLMVDEGQDNNLLQYQLVKMLGYPNYNLFLVGDDDQSMYKFRGASPQSFIDFKAEYKNVVQLPLTFNYRSNEEILNTANKLIKYNNNRIEKQLIPANKNDEKSVFYNHYTSEVEEAKEIVKEIETLEKDGVKYVEIACLYRTNAQSKSLEDELIINGIPYILHGGVSFYDRKEVKDMISYLQLVNDTTNNEAYERICNVPNRYFGKQFIENLKQIGGSFFEAMTHVKAYNRSQNANIQQFRNMVFDLQDVVKKGSPLTAIVDKILDDYGYLEYLANDQIVDLEDEDNPVLENIRTLKYLLERFDNLADFVKHVDCMVKKRKTSKEDEEGFNGVNLMTIHKSKGLEFPAVFVTGVSQGLLPHKNALMEVDEEQDKKETPIEEERRLCYVAVTRAERKCYISSIATYQNKALVPSVFVQEMELKVDEQEENDMEEKVS